MVPVDYLNRLGRLRGALFLYGAGWAYLLFFVIYFKSTHCCALVFGLAEKQGFLFLSVKSFVKSGGLTTKNSRPEKDDFLFFTNLDRAQFVHTFPNFSEFHKSFEK